jgi:xyloglucan fucosyltransferase
MKSLLETGGEPAHPEVCKGHRYQRKLRHHGDTIRKLKPVGLIFILGTILTFWTLKSSWPWLGSAGAHQQMVSERGTTELPLEVKALIENIKDARLRAEKARPNASFGFTERDRQAWHEANPCASRRELWPLYNERRHSEILQENPYMAEVLREYSRLHRACMQNVGRDVVKFFLRKDTSSGCKFVLGDNEVGTGIGNKILSAAAQVVYAILTQRVLLVPVSTSVPGVMCEPFEGSRWGVATDGILTPGKLHRQKWRPVSDTLAGTDAVAARRNASAVYAARVTEDWDCQPQQRFFCDAEQAFLASHVTWLYFSECLYYLPKLFAVPRFRPTLEALFPDQLVLPHVLRTALLPSDPVWHRVLQLHHVHLKHVDHRVGIQARYFHGKRDFTLLHTATEAAFAKCLLENHLLPNMTNSVDSTIPTTTPTTYLVFITSLYDGVKDHLTKIYVRGSRRGAAVGVVQLTHEDRQQFGEEVDRQALAEVLGLSLCDEMVVTPQSTFGAIAAGYGAVVPYFVDIRANTTSAGCVRGHSVDACYQLPSSKHFTCPHNRDVDQKLIADVVPYIHDCHPIETPFVKVHGAGLVFQIMSRYNQSRVITNST